MDMHTMKSKTVVTFVYFVREQLGSRWLDNNRLIFYDFRTGDTFLWDVEDGEEGKATKIDGIKNGKSSQFAFTQSGETLFMLRGSVTSDIYLLEISK